ncbi:MAG TPA: heparan-alpha-glucosaminide N-acetyltransferase domain-containing protein [Gemmatales bacterium]|nr:heparan-alpha-glucosaminide N-acetyltransferase domain-containing protein [Gemmatales bacterium]
MSTSPTGRLTYLDQFRGYTILGMILVNYLGDIPKHIHPVLRHHSTYCSYADTIMPQFFFAVGFALRFTMVKRLRTEGWWPAHGRVVKRVLALLMIAAIVHGFDNVKMSWDILCEQGIWQWMKQCCSRSFFQTLTHIAVTTLWVLPVIGARWPVRLIWLIASAWLHIVLSQEFYLKFVFTGEVIDGGPLGFLTWTIPVLVGSFASDFMTQPVVKRPISTLLLAGGLVMAVGYAFSCLQSPPAEAGHILPTWHWAVPPFMPPFDPDRPGATYAERHNIKREKVITLWSMSQKSGSVSYLTFGAGFSLAVLALCVFLFRDGREFGLFRTLGSNALVAYIIHGMTIDAVVKVLPKDSPLVVVLAGLAIVVGVTWLICRWLEKQGWYVRV